MSWGKRARRWFRQLLRLEQPTQPVAPPLPVYDPAFAAKSFRRGENRDPFATVVEEF